MFALIVAFFLVALLYASVGLGGGSTYSALLVLSGVDYRVLPVLALICNITVVAGGAWRFHKGRYIQFKNVAPFIIPSVPFAWLGGRLPVSEETFVGGLAISLAVAGLLLCFQASSTISENAPRPLVLGGTIGAGLGFLSGLVGIGGGIFLAPLLYLLKWDNARAIAGTCSLFILINSISGLTGQLMKSNHIDIISALTPYWMLLPAVLIGGQIGSRLGVSILPEAFLRRITAVLILYVAARLTLQWYNLVLS